jgi:hypothetical protein
MSRYFGIFPHRNHQTIQMRLSRNPNKIPCVRDHCEYDFVSVVSAWFLFCEKNLIVGDFGHKRQPNVPRRSPHGLSLAVPRARWGGSFLDPKMGECESLPGSERRAMLTMQMEGRVQELGILLLIDISAARKFCRAERELTILWHGYHA